MFFKESDLIKRYLNLHLAKGFIQTSLTFYSSLVFFLRNQAEKFDFVLTIKD